VFTLVYNLKEYVPSLLLMM